MTIRTRILLLSDTHAAPLHAPTSPYAYRPPLPAADLAIHAGDLTDRGDPAEYATTLAMLSALPTPMKLVIPGNHDLSLDPAHHTTTPAAHAAARALWTSPAARAAGIVYLDEGEHAFTLANGARLIVHATPYTPAFGNMAFAHRRHEDRWNLPSARLEGSACVGNAPLAAGIDISISHGPPHGIMDGVYMSNAKSATPVGSKAQTLALARVRPRLAVFGHIHEGWGAQRIRGGEGGVDEVVVGREVLAGGRPVEQVVKIDCSAETGTPVEVGHETLCVNAAIMDMRSRSVNAPFLVDLELPEAEEALS